MQPFPAVRGPFLGKKHVQHAIRIVFLRHRQLNQPAGFPGHGGHAKLGGIHFSQPLEPRHRQLALLALRLDPVQVHVPLRLVQGVVDLLAHVDPEQRRHRHIDAPRLDQGPEVPQEQRAQQRGYMQSVGIRIGQNANLVVTQPVQVVAARVHAQRQADVVHFLGAQHLARIHLPGVQDLAAQGHDRLGLPVAGLFRRTTRRIPLHQKQLCRGRFLDRAVRQLARQLRTGDNALANDLPGGLQP